MDATETGSVRYCPRGQHRGHWHEGSPPLDRFTDGSGWACPGLLADGSVCGYELRAAGAADPGMVLVAREDLARLVPLAQDFPKAWSPADHAAFRRLSAAAEVAR